MKPTQHDVETLLSFPPPYQIKNVTTPEPINGLKNNYEINHKKYKKIILVLNFKNTKF
jgi:hypothetical protein